MSANNSSTEPAEQLLCEQHDVIPTYKQSKTASTTKRSIDDIMAAFSTRSGYNAPTAELR